MTELTNPTEPVACPVHKKEMTVHARFPIAMDEKHDCVVVTYICPDGCHFITDVNVPVQGREIPKGLIGSGFMSNGRG